MEEFIEVSDRAGCGERKHVVQIDEHQRMIVAVEGGDPREVRPAVSDVDFGLLETPEQRCRVHQIEILLIRLGTSPVVEIEDPIVAFQLHLEEALVPSKMSSEVARLI